MHYFYMHYFLDVIIIDGGLRYKFIVNESIVFVALIMKQGIQDTIIILQ